MQKNDGPTILTSARMARRLGVDRRWLEGEARDGRLPAVQAGEGFLFDPRAVEAAIKARLAEAAKGVERGE